MKLTFKEEIMAGIPDILPEPKPYDEKVNHAPKRKDILTPEQKELALRNALRYFPKKHHALLAPEFAEELRRYGRIYMYRLRPDYEMKARHIDEYPYRSRQAAAIMMMINNNLDNNILYKSIDSCNSSLSLTVFLGFLSFTPFFLSNLLTFLVS